MVRHYWTHVNRDNKRRSQSTGRMPVRNFMRDMCDKERARQVRAAQIPRRLEEIHAQKKSALRDGSPDKAQM